MIEGGLYDERGEGGTVMHEPTEHGYVLLQAAAAEGPRPGRCATGPAGHPAKACGTCGCDPRRTAPTCGFAPGPQGPHPPLRIAVGAVARAVAVAAPGGATRAAAAPPEVQQRVARVALLHEEQQRARVQQGRPCCTP
ncbi:hypothetical protein GCM10009665_25550 [Kitasatospora nipponensis]|uniref:Uncharacterized protein n=1 Tax=Kitasatospora nipponensis TaxID=258049 RepID=A0ABN1W6T5_9ACTN